MYSLLDLLLVALSMPATTYGYGEKMCGMIGKPIACVSGLPTSTGEKFNTKFITGALPVPKGFRFKSFIIYVKTYRNECIPIRINDKSNHRWVGKRGIDLSPAAVLAITGKIDKNWSGRLSFCLHTFSDIL